MDNLISRQAAIDAICDHLDSILGQTKYDEGIAFGYEAAHRHICDVIKTLPSVRPKTTLLTYCGDCKYKDDGIDEDGIPFLKCLNGRSYGGTRINDYCSWGERREDG